MCRNRQQFLITIGLVLGLNSITKAAVDDMEDFYSMSPAELAELSVSIATGTAKPVFQSAAVTSVVTASQIKAMGATELHEVLETIPGLHVSIQANTYDYIYTMRGIRNGTNSQVLVLLDGNRFSVPYQGRSMIGLELPVENIQQVEVIRGPGSAMYGADAFAGVINIITKKAKDIEGTTIGGRIGNWDTQSTWAQHGSHWAGWDVAASLQYQHTNGDDQRIINADSQSQIDSLLGTNVSHAPGAMQTQFESWNAHLNLQRKHWDIGFWAFNAESGTRAGAAAALDLQGKGNVEQYMGSIRFSTEDWFNDWEFLAHASYLYSDFQTNQLQVFPANAKIPIDQDGNINLTRLRPGERRIPVLFAQGVKDMQGRTQQVPSFEFSGIYKGFKDHRLRFQTGYRYEEIKTREIKNFGPGVLSGNPPPATVHGAMTDVTGSKYVYLPDANRSIWSLAIQDEWQIAQDWQLTAGVRFDHYSDFGATVNPRVALVWDINKQLTSKLLYGRAFRAPNFSEQGNANNPVLLGNSDLDPEIINTIELAFDYRPFQSLRTGVNLYYYAIEDLIEVGQGSFMIQNNDNDQVGYGLEFEWNWQLHERFFISGNYAWQHSHNKVTDQDVAGVPEQQLYVAALWEFMPKWSLQTQLKWIGERNNMRGDKRKNLEDYETVDITLRGKKIFDHLNLSASVRNVFNKHAREPAVAALPDHIPTQGRSFYFEASVHY
jgi:iron complex outermembrane receptor protein